MKEDEGEGTNERMKIVIGYDGSEHAGAALDDLRRAGLPRDAEALIVSVAEVSMPPLSVSGIAENGLDPERMASAVTYASNAIAQAKEFARLGGERIKSSFPEWEVSAEYLVGDPADALMERATNWGTDLIVVGSQGRSAIGRLILGSVSRKIVTEARCSVRVARATITKGDRPARIIIGMDGSSFANAAVDVVTARRWPAGVEARIVTITKPFHMYGETTAMQKSRARVIQDAAMAEISEIYEKARRLTAADVMTKAVATVDPQDQVGQAAETMMRDDLRRIPVTHDGKLVGIISRSDIIHLLASS